MKKHIDVCINNQGGNDLIGDFTPSAEWLLCHDLFLNYWNMYMPEFAFIFVGHGKIHLYNLRLFHSLTLLCIYIIMRMYQFLKIVRMPSCLLVSRKLLEWSVSTAVLQAIYCLLKGSVGHDLTGTRLGRPFCSPLTLQNWKGSVEFPQSMAVDGHTVCFCFYRF